jgi:hypothetical protein
MLIEVDVKCFNKQNGRRFPARQLTQSRRRGSLQRPHLLFPFPAFELFFF